MKMEALLAAAEKALRAAYVPYSQNRVGAALLCADGMVFTGCTVENSSFGLTVCAEHAAVLSAIGAGRRDFVALAIVSAGEAMPYPCGGCRQVLKEFCREELSVYVARSGALEDYEVLCLAVLLPYGFHR